jgi:hypothetical protein
LTNCSDTLHDLVAALYSLEERAHKIRHLIEEGNSAAAHALLAEQDSAVAEVQRQVVALDVHQRNAVQHAVPIMASALERAYNELLDRLHKQKENVLHQLMRIQQQQGLYARSNYDNP